MVELLSSLGKARAHEVATKLITEFGTLADVLRAKRIAHLRLFGDARAWRALQPVRRAVRYYHRANLQRYPLFDNWGRLIDYLRSEMAAEPIEHFRVLYLDARNGLIRDEVMARGTIDQCHVGVREVIVRALELDAKNLVLVHNHPSGSSKPSLQDIRLTRQMVEAARNLGIVVHDHIVIARDGHTSLRAQGQL